jgi:hypothetical protein
MTAQPYVVVRRVMERMHPPRTPTEWECHYELADTPNVSAQREWLTIRTRVAPPLPNHPQALELAALLRVRELLDQQIQGMQSP